MIRKIDCLSDIKAEGDIGPKGNAFPYNTELVSINGVHMHMWMGDTTPTDDQLAGLERLARNTRDIVRMTWSPGAPVGYWAHQNIP